MTVSGSSEVVRYLVLVERTENNWAAFAPDIWGCVATGTTREEAERNL